MVSDINTLNETLDQARMRWIKEQHNLDQVTLVPVENQRHECSRCGSVDRLRHFWTFSEHFTFHHRSSVALCFDCDHRYLAFGGGQR